MSVLSKLVESITCLMMPGNIANEECGSCTKKSMNVSGFISNIRTRMRAPLTQRVSDAFQTRRHCPVFDLEPAPPAVECLDHRACMSLSHADTESQRN
jgi:hypothetical protein